MASAGNTRTVSSLIEKKIGRTFKRPLHGDGRLGHQSEKTGQLKNRFMYLVDV